MDTLLALLPADPVLAFAGTLFAKRMGVPVPALPFLLVAGAHAAADPRFALAALLAGSAAAIVADVLWFLAGRRHGRAVLALTCRISLAPGTCIRRSELLFARRGGVAVLFAKFIPGVAGLAPPLAGALAMRSAPFLALNAAGTVLWIATGMAAGLVFRHQVDLVLHRLALLGSAALPVLAGALVLYLAWLAVRRARARRYLHAAAAAAQAARDAATIT